MGVGGWFWLCAGNACVVGFLGGCCSLVFECNCLWVCSGRRVPHSAVAGACSIACLPASVPGWLVSLAAACRLLSTLPARPPADTTRCPPAHTLSRPALFSPCRPAARTSPSVCALAATQRVWLCSVAGAPSLTSHTASPGHRPCLYKPPLAAARRVHLPWLLPGIVRQAHLSRTSHRWQLCDGVHLP